MASISACLPLRCAGREPHRLDVGDRRGDHGVHALPATAGLRHRRGQLGVPGSILLGQALGIGGQPRRRTLVGVDRRALPAAGGLGGTGANGQSQATPDPAPKPSRALPITPPPPAQTPPHSSQYPLAAERGLNWAIRPRSDPSAATRYFGSNSR